jgi:hypothetical protein
MEQAKSGFCCSLGPTAAPWPSVLWPCGLWLLGWRNGLSSLDRDQQHKQAPNGRATKAGRACCTLGCSWLNIGIAIT